MKWWTVPVASARIGAACSAPSPPSAAGELAERAKLLDRHFLEEGATSLLPGGSNTPDWRCDPVPLILPPGEFDALAAGLAQRATLLEAVLQDVYGPQTLLAEGLLPPALVYANPAFLRSCRAAGGRREGPLLQLYAADLLRAPDGNWRVLSDRTAGPTGLAHVLENRRALSRYVPELVRARDLRRHGPFFDIWQDALQRLAPPATAGWPQPRRRHAHLRAFQPALVRACHPLPPAVLRPGRGRRPDGARRRAVPEDAARPAAGGRAAAPGGWAADGPAGGRPEPRARRRRPAGRGPRRHRPHRQRPRRRLRRGAGPRRLPARPRAAPAGRGACASPAPARSGWAIRRRRRWSGRISAAGWCAARWTARCARSPPPPCRRRRGPSSPSGSWPRPRTMRVSARMPASVAPCSGPEGLEPRPIDPAALPGA